MHGEWDWLTSEDSHSRAEIVKTVKKFYKNDEDEHGLLKYYTIHNTIHCERVEDLIHKLIPDEDSKALSSEERYLLLTSAWLHDIGMLKSIARERTTNPRELSDLSLRENHHKNSAWFITNKASTCGLAEDYATVMSNLCIYHRQREDINRLEPEIWIGTGTRPIRQQLLAAYLRLADALDLGVHRAPKRAYVMWLASNIPAEYRLHWIKNRLVTGIHIDHQRKAILVSFQKPRADVGSVFQEKLVLRSRNRSANLMAFDLSGKAVILYN